MYPFNCRFKVTSPYGQRTLNGTVEQHNGIDLVPIVTDRDAGFVNCTVAGTVGAVTMVTDKSNLTWQWGKYVRVDGDDGCKYYYCHLSAQVVQVGERISAGDHIGRYGSTGYSFGNHLHYEVRKNNVAIDPTTSLGISNCEGTYGVDWEALWTEVISAATVRTIKGAIGYPYAFMRKIAVTFMNRGANR